MWSIFAEVLLFESRKIFKTINGVVEIYNVSFGWEVLVVVVKPVLHTFIDTTRYIFVFNSRYSWLRRNFRVTSDHDIYFRLMSRFILSSSSFRIVLNTCSTAGEILCIVQWSAS